MCDVTIKIEHSGVKKKFSAHKLVLAASSPYFKAMFAGIFSLFYMLLFGTNLVI